MKKFLMGFIQKNTISFFKYLEVGISISVLNIVLLWLLIDFVGIPTIISSISIVIFLFLLKYGMYELLKLMHKQFFKYTLISIVFMAMNVLSIWFLIDLVGIPTIISSILVVGGLFVLKFFVYKFAGMVKEEKIEWKF